MDPALYDDGLVRLDRSGLTIRRYYFPFATSKRIPYARILGVQDRQMGALSGRGRIWGSGDLRHWAPLDLDRPRKDRAIILNLGGWVRPVITPTDLDRVLAILRERTSSA